MIYHDCFDSLNRAYEIYISELLQIIPFQCLVIKSETNQGLLVILQLVGKHIHSYFAESVPNWFHLLHPKGCEKKELDKKL